MLTLEQKAAAFDKLAGVLTAGTDTAIIIEPSNKGDVSLRKIIHHHGWLVTTPEDGRNVHLEVSPDLPDIFRARGSDFPEGLCAVLSKLPAPKKNKVFVDEATGKRYKVIEEED